MIFKLHFWLVAAGANAIGILIGVFLQHYTDASSLEIGALFMLMPFVGMIFRPLLASMADRDQAHRKYLIGCLWLVILSYAPFIVVPYLGPEVYEKRARVCWYTLATLKILGDIAFDGMKSIGDSVAINYAKRIGTEFNVYRVWGTVAWLTFGIIIGQINEVHFMPKYVPGFLILLLCSLLDILFIWLWPEEYFQMMRTNDEDNEESLKKREKTNEKQGYFSSMSKSLMPKEVVWAHIKAKLVMVFTCGKVDRRRNLASYGGSLVSTVGSGFHKESECPPERIDKVTQIRILGLLLRKDPRIVLYLVFFVFAGASVVPLGFFIMSLADICNTQATCNFSKLAGLLQVSMALVETVLFIYIRRIISWMGRVNICALTMAVSSVKYLFYGTIWLQVNPYWSLIAEQLYGFCYVVYLTLMVELGHEFANEVKYIIPQLIERGIIKPNSDLRRVETSLGSTMQALVASFNDGLGRGFGALIYGLYLEHHSYESLWFWVGVGASVASLMIIAVNILDKFFKFNLGISLEVAGQSKNSKLDCEIAPGFVEPNQKGQTGSS